MTVLKTFGGDEDGENSTLLYRK